MFKKKKRKKKALSQIIQPQNLLSQTKKKPQAVFKTKKFIEKSFY